MDWMTIIWAVLMGTISGMLTATAGYLKGTKLPKVDNEKFFMTVGLGAIVGGIAGYFGWDYMAAEQWLLSSGLIAFVEWLLKAVWRRSGLGDRKTKAGPKAVRAKKKALKPPKKKRAGRWLPPEDRKIIGLEEE